MSTKKRLGFAGSFTDPAVIFTVIDDYTDLICLYYRHYLWHNFHSSLESGLCFASRFSSSPSCFDMANLGHLQRLKYSIKIVIFMLSGITRCKTAQFGSVVVQEKVPVVVYHRFPDSILFRP